MNFELSKGYLEKYKRQGQNKILNLVMEYFPWMFTPAGIYLLKVNNGNTRTRDEICSKLTIKIPYRYLYC